MQYCGYYYLSASLPLLLVFDFIFYFILYVIFNFLLVLSPLFNAFY